VDSSRGGSSDDESDAALDMDACATELLLALQRHSDDACVQEAIVCTVGHLARHPSGRDALVRRGCVRELAAAMLRHWRVADLQRNTLRSLFKLQDERAAVWSSDGASLAAKAIVAALHMHDSDADVQWVACATLWKLSRPYARELVAAGTAKQLVVAMRRHTQSSNGSVDSRPANGVAVGDVTGAAMEALLTLSGAAEHRAVVARAGALEATLEAMRRRVSSVAVQECGCGIVANVAAWSDAAKETVADADCATVVVAAMRQHPDAAAVQANGCNALWHAVPSDTCSTRQRQRITAAIARARECVHVACEAMRRHPEDTYLLQQACGAIRGLAAAAVPPDGPAGNKARSGVGSDAATAAVDGVLVLTLDDVATAARSVADAMRRHPTVAGVQEHGCGALWNLEAGVLRASLPPLVAGVTDAPVLGVSALRTFGVSSSSIARNACGMLHAISRSDEAVRCTIVDEGAVEALLAALRAHLASPVTVELILCALSSIAWSERARATLVPAAAPTTAIASAGGGASSVSADSDTDGNVRRATVRAGASSETMATAIGSSSVTRSSSAASGVELLQSAMVLHTYAPAVQLWACRTLWLLADSDDSNVALARAGCVEAVAAAARRSHAHIVVEEAFSVLCRMARTASLRRQLLAADVWQSAMRSHGTASGCKWTSELLELLRPEHYARESESVRRQTPQRYRMACTALPVQQEFSVRDYPVMEVVD
jgi:hypothetical protein